MKPMLADVWTREDVRGWWLSEKLDGVRALWTGSELLSREGNTFPAPAWFREQLGSVPLDGELWCGRGAFSRAMGIAKTHDGEAWRSVLFCAFDLPRGDLPVEARISLLSRMNETANKRIVPHRRCEGKRDFRETLVELYRGGAEGFILREPESLYVEGRSESWLKVRCASNMGMILTAKRGGFVLHS